MFHFPDLIPQQPIDVHVCDIGAMTLGPDTDAYGALVTAGMARVIGFEPVQTECDKLNRLYSPERIFLPYVIGDGRKKTFYICNNTMTSSLYPPNSELLDRFQNLENLTQVVNTAPVDTVRLDDIPEVGNVDFLKVDVQGAEADVFDGAPRVLRDTIVIHTEVQFAPMYRGTPLFSEIDIQLREHGFVLHRFAGIGSRTFKPLIVNNNVNTRGTQLLWGDAVYIPDFMNLERLSPEKLLKLTAILHVVYHSYDTAAYFLQEHDRRTGDNLANRYINRLSEAVKAKSDQASRPTAF